MGQANSHIDFEQKGSVLQNTFADADEGIADEETKCCFCFQKPSPQKVLFTI